MKAPDKIYLTEWDGKGVSEYDTHWSTGYYDEELQNCKNHKYIRIDALLEWANEAKYRTGMLTSEYGRGYTKALETIIDKLKSL